MRRIAAILLLTPALLFAQQKPATTIQLPPAPLLPMSFAGWTATAPPVESTTPPAADAALLNEYGFKRTATATYTSNGQTLHATAFQFEDATGAYGAYSTYGNECPIDTCEGVQFEFHVDIKPNKRTPPFLQIYGHSRYKLSVFWQGDTLVKITSQFFSPWKNEKDFDVLASNLPVPSGRNAETPLLPCYLPTSGLDNELIQYSLGPAGYAILATIPTDLIDFSRDAEVVTAYYKLSSGLGFLTLIEYPTPQIAIERQQAISSWLRAGNKPRFYNGTSDTASVQRTGPIVAIATGNFSQKDADALASSVHYETTLTWNHPEGYVSEAWKAAHLYLGIAALSGILISAAVLLGLFLGGGRALYRVMRGKPASSVMDTEFLHLDLGRGGDYVPHHDTDSKPPAPPTPPN